MALARELYRNASEAAQFRDANERTNSYLAGDPDVLPRHRPGTKDKAKLQALLRKLPGVAVDSLDDWSLYEKFLEAIVRLDKAEIDEVESATFKLMDAHYLEGCYLLREIARSLPLQGLSPLEQAAYCFSWVTRHVLLEQGRDELLPPQFVLRRGQGSAAERAFVFMALLQQIPRAPGASAPHLDGCLIALPGKEGQFRPWLAGVLITVKDQQDVYLFEPRLGLPVPGPKGKGIATLRDLRANPTLLDGFKVQGDVYKYDVDAAQAAQAEILLACPLSGLSARMRYLEDELLFGFDQVNVAVRAADLLDQFEKLNAGPVRVWTAPSPLTPTPLPVGERGRGEGPGGGKQGGGGLAAQTPTRALRLFLPPEEGGIDKNQRLELFKRQMLPGPAILQGFAEEKVAKADLRVGDAELQLEWLAQQLWMNYIYTPSQELLRGRLDDCTRRLVRIQKVIDDVRGNNVDQAEIAKWQDRVREAYVKRDAAKISEIWGEDQWLRQLVAEPDEEPANPRQLPKKLLSDIVLGAVSEPLHLKCAYLLALRWQEMAERLQAQAARMAGANADRAAKAKEDARAAWSNADSRWSWYEHDNPLTVESLKARLEIVNNHVKGNRQPLAAGLLEYYARLVREAASARLMHVRALEELGKTGPAEATLKKLVAELTALEKQALADLAPTGSLFWLRYTASLKLAAPGEAQPPRVFQPFKIPAAHPNRDRVQVGLEH